MISQIFCDNESTIFLQNWAGKWHFILFFCFWLLKYHLFLQNWWFLQNLEKGFIWTNMHTTVNQILHGIKVYFCHSFWVNIFPVFSKFKRGVICASVQCNQGIICDFATSFVKRSVCLCRAVINYWWFAAFR